MNSIEFLKEKRFNLVKKQKEISNTLEALSTIRQPNDIIFWNELKSLLNEVKRLRKTYNFLICNYDLVKTLILN